MNKLLLSEQDALMLTQLILANQFSGMSIRSKYWKQTNILSQSTNLLQAYELWPLLWWPFKQIDFDIWNKQLDNFVKTKQKTVNGWKEFVNDFDLQRSLHGWA